jgi:uncharacterized protein YecE (DUF72 family)
MLRAWTLWLHCDTSDLFRVGPSRTAHGEVENTLAPPENPSVPSKRKVASIADQTLTLFTDAPEVCAVTPVVSLVTIPGLHIGTSAFSAPGWLGSFYPAQLRAKNYLRYYATKYNTVEIDSTYYGTPAVSTVNGWYEKTPPGFVFAAKVPKIVTHEKILSNCEKEFDEFVVTMRRLKEKLGPLVLQFPHFDGRDIGQREFMTRLRFFLKRIAGTTVRLAIEIRNQTWLDQKFADLLAEHAVALVLQDLAWMPLPHQLKFDCITADFAYVRLLGDRKDIEKVTKTWDRVVIDRSQELRSWVDACQQVVRRGIPTFVYANNHYQGHGPATVAQFLEIWNCKWAARSSRQDKR